MDGMGVQYHGVPLCSDKAILGGFLWGYPQIIQVIRPFLYWNLWFWGSPYSEKPPYVFFQRWSNTPQDSGSFGCVSIFWHTPNLWPMFTIKIKMNQQIHLLFFLHFFFKQGPFWGTPTSSCLCRWVTAVASGFEGKITSEPAATPGLSLGPVWRPVTTAKWLWMQAACLKTRTFHDIPPRSKVFMSLPIQMALFIWSIP